MNDKEKVAVAVAAAGIAGVGIYAYMKSKSAKAAPSTTTPPPTTTPPTTTYATLNVIVDGQGSVQMYDNGTLVATVTNSGSQYSVSQSFNIPVGDTVSLNAVPASGWQFEGFSSSTT